MCGQVASRLEDVAGQQVPRWVIPSGSPDVMVGRVETGFLRCLLPNPELTQGPAATIPLLSLGEVCTDCAVVCLEWSQLGVRPSQGSQTGH